MFKNTTWDLAKFEVCGHRWMDVSEGNYGVSIFNRETYGMAINNQVMALSLLKSAKMPYKGADMGNHRLRYAIYPHCGGIIEAEVPLKARAY